MIGADGNPPVSQVLYCFYSARRSFFRKDSYSMQPCPVFFGAESKRLHTPLRLQSLREPGSQSESLLQQHPPYLVYSKRH